MKKSFVKNNRLIFLGICFGLTFFLLLALRLNLIRLTGVPSHTFSTGLEQSGISDSETWMNIFLKDAKIGYTHRQIKNTLDGYALHETTYLKMNVMGMVQDIFIDASSLLNRDFTLSSFHFDVSSGTFAFPVAGKIKDSRLHVTIGNDTKTIPVKPPVYIYAGLLDALKTMDLLFEKPITFQTFDPLSLTNEPVTVTLVKKEMIRIGHRFHDAAKLDIAYKGFVQHAWIDEAGNILMEAGPMGMRSEKTAREAAVRGFNVRQLADLTESISILPNVPINNPEALTRLELRLSGTQNTFNLDGGRQAFYDDILTITKEDFGKPRSGDSEDLEDFLKPSPIIQSGHEKIKKVVSQITRASDPTDIRAKTILSWIYENIEKRPVLSIPNAVETLENKKGDCNEHAVLLAAMARAAGIPARIETGLVYMKGRFYYHAWNVLYLDDWVTADAALGQMPADVTHIRLIRGEMVNQMDLVHAIGKLKIDILESSNDSAE